MKKQTILITGASSGIGKAAALLLQRKGHTVFAAARQVDKMKELKETGVQILSMDVTREDSMKTAVQSIFNQAGTIDVLVNNAGYGSYGALEDVPLSEARYQFEVNVFGLARLTQLVLPGMREQHYGKIINVSSIGGKIGEPHGAWYHATKFAVEGLSDSIRMELKQFGIQVVIIEPGTIKTEWTGIARDNLLKTSGHTVYQELAKKHARMFESADKRGADPNIVARTIEKAIRVPHPRTRYATGGGAKPILFVRKILSDRQFDRLMLRIMR